MRLTRNIKLRVERRDPRAVLSVPRAEHRARFARKVRASGAWPGPLTGTWTRRRGRAARNAQNAGRAEAGGRDVEQTMETDGRRSDFIQRVPGRAMWPARKPSLRMRRPRRRHLSGLSARMGAAWSRPEQGRRQAIPASGARRPGGARVLIAEPKGPARE